MGPAPLLLAAFAAGAASPMVDEAASQATALDTDCRAVGPTAHAGYQFIVTCAGRARLPHGRLAVVQRSYEKNQPPIKLQDSRVRRLTSIPALGDDMPFQLFWSLDSRWFFANHHVGSFLDQLQVFEIVGRRPIDRPALFHAAARIATIRYPCLASTAVLPNGVRWSGDRHVILVTASRPDACAATRSGALGWRPLWMIGDVRTGRVLPGSIRVVPDEGGFRSADDQLNQRTTQARQGGKKIGHTRRGGAPRHR